MQIIESVRQLVRKIMRQIARLLNSLSGGKIKPNTVTIVGLVAHIPIALLIATDNFIIAAVLLVIFGLFDTLDGELARLQSKSSPAGMLLDASTDRMKEVFLYSGAAYSIANSTTPTWSFIAVLACGASLCVSYIKAKGESAVATSDKKPSHTVLNKMFADGLALFEIRMFLLVIGLLAGQLIAALIIITTLASLTAVFRLYKISKFLSS